MKYCKKCGMLLEDTQDICISCGTDVTIPENTSQFPPEIAEKMQSRKEQDKKKTGIIIAILIIFVLLAILIGVIAAVASNQGSSARDIVEEEETEEEVEEALAEPEETEEEAEEEVETPKVPDNRKVSDDLGTYYIVGEGRDSAGLLVFETLYPEEFTSFECTFDNTNYTDLFPIVMNCVVTNEENTLRMTYMSPEHFWYQKSTKSGKSRNNEVDLDYYMSYYSYDGPQAYLEALIKQAYAGAKKLELVESHEASEGVLAALGTMVSNKTKELTGDIGDYAHIGSSTVYTLGDPEYSAAYYKYIIITKGKEQVYADFYLPMISHTFTYTNDQTGDAGTVTEWLPLCVISYESGNAEKYEFYAEAFTVFVNNSRLTEDFFRVNEAYGKVIDEAMDAKRDPEPLTDELLAKLESELDRSGNLKTIDKDIMSFLSTPDSTLLTFSEGDISVTGVADTKQAFYSESRKMVFITPSEKEYPGNEFIDLFAKAEEQNEQEQ
ncbi:MAG: zinc ribbon domain-containing protein [Lachnospiraceae bacterium]|nr:zinc ribbon domain-containing protein [Lachnospiraceae bacterium]